MFKILVKTKLFDKNEMCKKPKIQIFFISLYNNLFITKIIKN